MLDGEPRVLKWHLCPLPWTQRGPFYQRLARGGQASHLGDWTQREVHTGSAYTHTQTGTHTHTHTHTNNLLSSCPRFQDLLIVQCVYVCACVPVCGYVCVCVHLFLCHLIASGGRQLIPALIRRITVTGSSSVALT